MSVCIKLKRVVSSQILSFFFHFLVFFRVKKKIFSLFFLRGYVSKMKCGNCSLVGIEVYDSVVVMTAISFKIIVVIFYCPKLDGWDSQFWVPITMSGAHRLN